MFSLLFCRAGGVKPLLLLADVLSNSCVSPHRAPRRHVTALFFPLSPLLSISLSLFAPETSRSSYVRRSCSAFWI